jgi:hypothetical protein
MATYNIALLGDGMFEKWGVETPELLNEFKRLYSRTDFVIENHGLEGSRAGNALWRISNNYQQNGNLHNSLSLANPDITVVESFAYAHRIDGPEGMSEYRDLLRRVVDEIRHTTTSKVLFCIGIPPHRERFLETAEMYVNTSRATRQRFSDDVKLYLDESRRIAQDEEWPLADVCVDIEKRVMQGENMRRFIDQNDCVSPSRYGYSVMATVLVRAMDNHRMVEEVLSH